MWLLPESVLWGRACSTALHHPQSSVSHCTAPSSVLSPQSTSLYLSPQSYVLSPPSSVTSHQSSVSHVLLHPGHCCKAVLLQQSVLHSPHYQPGLQIPIHTLTHPPPCTHTDCYHGSHISNLPPSRTTSVFTTGSLEHSELILWLCFICVLR